MTASLGEGIDPQVLPRVLGLARELERVGGGITDVVVAYGSLTVYYDPLSFMPAHGDPYRAICAVIEACAERATPATAAAQVHEIPVCYGGEMGPDLGEVALHAGVSPEEVVRLHASAEYLVHAVGFTPGFPYMGGLPVALHMPRRPTPRTRVAPGSVGIGGSQTGVYPSATPGGWNLIGRSPLRFFDPKGPRASRLRPGDRVRFVPIDPQAFDSWK